MRFHRILMSVVNRCCEMIDRYIFDMYKYVLDKNVYKNLHLDILRRI